MANRNVHQRIQFILNDSEIDSNKPWISYLKMPERFTPTINGGGIRWSYPNLGNGDISGPFKRGNHIHNQEELIIPKDFSS
jgi:hypothetical protein